MSQTRVIPKSTEDSINTAKGLITALWAKKDVEIAEAYRSTIPAMVTLYGQYQQLKNYVTSLYNTELYQSVIIDNISDLGCSTSTVKPGTFGAYLCGCMLASSSSVTGATGATGRCGYMCSGAIPLEDTQPCDARIFFYDPNGTPSLTQTDISSTSNIAIIYVAYKTLASFPGFLQSELDELTEMGVTTVSLYGIAGPNSYIPLLANVAVSDLPTRTGPVPPTPSSNTTLLWIVILALVLIAVLYFVNMYRNSA